MGEWYIRREYNIGGVMPRAEVCERGADPFHIICEALPEVARRIVNDHEDAARLREMSEGMTACVKALDENQAWFSRSRIALTLRDALRAWADKAEALSAAPPPAGAAQEAPAAECGCPSRMAATRITTHTSECTAKRMLSNMSLDSTEWAGIDDR